MQQVHSPPGLLLHTARAQLQGHEALARLTAPLVVLPGNLEPHGQSHLHKRASRCVTTADNVIVDTDSGTGITAIGPAACFETGKIQPGQKIVWAS